MSTTVPQPPHTGNLPPQQPNVGNQPYTTTTLPKTGSKKRRWLIPLAVGFLIFSLGSVIGAAGSGGSKTETLAAESEPAVTVMAEPQAAVTVTAEPEPAVTVTAPAPPAVTVTAQPPTPAGPTVTIATGTWVVGPDVAPGIYKVTEPISSGYCYWSLTTTGSNGGDIIENDIVQGGLPQVTLSEGEDFETNDCGVWGKIG